MRKWPKRIFWAFVACVLCGAIGLGYVWSKFSRDADQYLPLFTQRVPPTLTKVLDSKGNVIGILANQKRTLIPYDDIPKAFQGAIVAVEDADFWKHGGVSSRGFFGAVYRGIKSGGKDRSGFSTLTMQLVRTVTEKRERNPFKGGFTRKIREIILARNLEKAFRKQQILEQYANEVNFGAGHYGIEAASQYYFRKSATGLNIEESALLAAMVQRPSKSHSRLFSLDPNEREIVRNRRNYVISRMAAEGYLKEEDAELLKERPIRLARENASEEDIAKYAVEEIKKSLVANEKLRHEVIKGLGEEWAEKVLKGLGKQYAEEVLKGKGKKYAEEVLKGLDVKSAEDVLKRLDAKSVAEVLSELGEKSAVEVLKRLVNQTDWLMEGGLVIHSTIDFVWQQAATETIRKGLLGIQRTRGLRKVDVRYEAPDTARDPSWQRFYEPGDTAKGIIMEWAGNVVKVRMGKTIIEVPSSSFEWAGKAALTELTRGAAPLFTIRETNPDGTPKSLELEQVPEVEGALLAVDNNTGEIRAMVGGYNFMKSQFNRSTQAFRQVGSTMKAFVYGAALSEGLTPATIVDDAPIMYQLVKDLPRKIEPGITHYQPKNYERDFWGPLTLWEALARSRNIPAVKTLEMAGIKSAVNYAKKCGIESNIPPYPSLALGATDLTLKEITRGYATIASGGYTCPEPFLIKKVVDRNGKVLEETRPTPRGKEPDVDPVANFQLIQMLQGVTSAGTAGGTSKELGWAVGGKTGTTDEYTDAWFVGFSTRVTCGVWVGLDEKRTIHSGASGSKVALPIWKTFMKKVLKTTPREDFKPPAGSDLEWVDLDVDTGLRVGPGTKRMYSLAFRPGTAPAEETDPEIAARTAEARARARSLPPEQRMWGTPIKKEEVEEPSVPAHNYFRHIDPNEN